MAEQHQSFDSKVTLNQTLPPPCSPTASPSPSSDSAANIPRPLLAPEGRVHAEQPPASSSPVAAVKPNRCSTCNRRVGLTGFKCRCGVTFCGSHRYPEQHACNFDFKAMGRQQILKANPVVIAPKLHKI